MRIFALVLASLSLLITIAFTIVPVGNIIIFPSIITIICAFIAFRIGLKEKSKVGFARLLMIVAFISLVTSIVRTHLTEDIIVEDQQFIEREEKSKDDAVKELEELEDDLEGLE